MRQCTSARAAGLAALALLAALAPATARGQAQEAAPPAATLGQPWAVRCVSAARAAPVDCIVEQRLALGGAGQAFVTVAVSVPAEPRSPTLVVTMPLGLYLPAGLRLRVDDGEAQRLDFQTCDSNGCHVAAPIAPMLLDALRSGKALHLTLESAAREAVTVDVPLAGLAAALARIE